MMGKLIIRLKRHLLILRWAMPVFIPVMLNGCATTTHGPTQRIIVSTPGAPGAKCWLKSLTLGEKYFITPEAIEVPRNAETVEISCSKTCFYDEKVTFTPAINVEDLAFNGLIGGIAPLAIDLATKRAYSYSYDFIVRMKPDKQRGCGRKGFLDGDPKDFDNRIDDFSFEERPVKLPNNNEEDLKINPQHLPEDKNNPNSSGVI